MSDELARAVSMASIVVTAVALTLAIVTVRRPAPVRPRADAVQIGISLLAIVVMAAILGIGTPVVLAVLAVLAGGALGALQGAHLRVEREAEGLLATRSVWALLAWGVGIVAVQIASLASRTGATEIGLAVGLFGVAMTVGVALGRTGPVREARKVAATAGVAAMVLLTVGFGFTGGSSSATAQRGSATPFTCNGFDAPSGASLEVYATSADSGICRYVLGRSSSTVTDSAAIAPQYGCDIDTRLGSYESADRGYVAENAILDREEASPGGSGFQTDLGEFPIHERLFVATGPYSLATISLHTTGGLEALDLVDLATQVADANQPSPSVLGCAPARSGSTTSTRERSTTTSSTSTSSTSTTTTTTRPESKTIAVAPTSSTNGGDDDDIAPGRSAGSAATGGLLTAGLAGWLARQRAYGARPGPGKGTGGRPTDGGPAVSGGGGGDSLELDTNEDGQVDTVLEWGAEGGLVMYEDADRDGVFETTHGEDGSTTVTVDTDDDGSFDGVIIDHEGDGTADEVVHRDPATGEMTTYAVDVDDEGNVSLTPKETVVGVDTDKDGAPDVIGTRHEDGTTRIDLDGDGVPDVIEGPDGQIDLDLDGDGQPDVDEVQPKAPTSSDHANETPAERRARARTILDGSFERPDAPAAAPPAPADTDGSFDAPGAVPTAGSSTATGAAASAAAADAATSATGAPPKGKEGVFRLPEGKEDATELLPKKEEGEAARSFVEDPTQDRLALTMPAQGTLLGQVNVAKLGGDVNVTFLGIKNAASGNGVEVSVKLGALPVQVGLSVADGGFAVTEVVLAGGGVADSIIKGVGGVTGAFTENDLKDLVSQPLRDANSRLTAGARSLTRIFSAGQRVAIVANAGGEK